MILPNYYLGTITGISDPGKHAEVTMTAGSVGLRGSVALSNTVARVLAGSVPPNNFVSADVGSLYLCTSGGATGTLYVKASGGSSNTGWLAK